ncbi:MAG: acylneuraminate cytidylyltransferase family protein [Candidatus Lokiarchaeota archaeon]|nr:acylneuraminate cytidylyltransferase family protein [Candidatus Lokiarchaeota archaeon]
MKEIYAIIPARGGSKGIKKKNIRSLKGHPLIAYSIKIAEKTNVFKRIIVSTDDDEISEYAKNYGAEVFKRSPSLAQDDTPMINVVLDVIKKLKEQNDDPEIIVLLQPTSPLRTPNFILESISLFKSENPESVISVCLFEHNPLWSLIIEKNRLVPLFSEEMKKTSRQQLSEVYRPNGSIYISSPDVLQRKKSFFTSKSIPYVMPSEFSIDIDTEYEFELVEFILENKNLKIL